MLRVKSIINYLTQRLSFDQIMRLEKYTEQIIDGRLSEDMFFKILTTPYERGGVGIDVLTSSEMAEKIKNIMERSRDIARYRKMRKKASVGTMHHQFVQNVRDYILDECQVILSEEQLNRLGVMVGNRIAGFTKKEDFKDQLEMSMEEGGVGLENSTVHRLTRYLEKLIAQGVHANSKGAGH
jgi:hypothetical protein